MPASSHKRHGALLIAAALPLSPAWGDGLSIQTSGSLGIGLGTVISGASDATVFRVSPGGSVTTVSGSGYRRGAAGGSVPVTLRCGTDPECADANVVVTIGSVGSTSGRAGNLTNFTVDAGTAQIIDPPSGTDPVSFTIAPVGQSGTASFRVGVDFPILGNASGAPTGPASASFQISARLGSSGLPIMAMGDATATVFRPLSLGNTADLAFGTILLSPGGSGSVTIDAATGARQVSGTGVQGLGNGSHRATFNVTGEGNQAFSIDIPGTFKMVSGDREISVALTSTAQLSQVLDGALGSEGAASFGVGGSFAIPPATGKYTGSFTVLVEYN